MPDSSVITAPAERAAETGAAPALPSKGASDGRPYHLMCAVAVALVAIMLLGMVALILVNGLGHFWPSPLIHVTLHDGKRYVGPVAAHKAKPQDRRGRLSGASLQYRTKFKIGNRDVYGKDHLWVEDAQIAQQQLPGDVWVFERLEYGNFHGWVQEVRQSGKMVADGSADGLESFVRLHEVALALRQNIARLEEQRQRTRRPLTSLEAKLSALEHSRFARTPEGAERIARLQSQKTQMERRFTREIAAALDQLTQLKQEISELTAVVSLADGQTRSIALSDIVRAYQPNSMSLGTKVAHYVGKLIEFVWENPRESNTEGGVFPALYGTVLMVLLMTIVVTPFGVVTALYMQEYAKQGRILRAVRIAVNNLAGVPSIVIGMFGLAFFVYGVGGGIDQLFYSEYLPTPTLGTGGIMWASLTLALLTVPVVIVATEEGLSAVPQAYREGSLALGTTKWQTICHVVLPNATPGILTGVILAISRAAGEVAPLMITGVVKLAPSLPLDAAPPFIHLERKFMHLGFHIYDVAMQSPNIEAALPMVYSTTALLLLLVLGLNSVATYARNRLRKKYAAAKL